MIKRMKYKHECQLCCFKSIGDDCKIPSSLKCNEYEYFINTKRTRPRKSRDRRLLEALLDELSIHIYSDGQGGFMFTEKRCAGHLKPSEAKQLIAIKQAMEKKGKKK